MSSPAELFPAITWGYVTDQIVLNKGGKPLLTRWFSFNHHLTSKYAILLSATAWMFVIYLLGETFETLEQWTLNRVAQKFILSLRNNVYPDRGVRR